MLPLDRILARPSWLKSRRRERIPHAARWRLLEGQPFSDRRRRIALLARNLPDGESLEGLRQAAREFDLIVFAFTSATDSECAPLLDICARLVLVEPPRSRPRLAFGPAAVQAWRSELMQTLWDGFSRQFNVDLRQVEGAEMASYGGDLLVARDGRSRTPSLRRWPRRWYEGRAFRRFRRVLHGEDGRMPLEACRELLEPPVTVRRAGERDVGDLDRLQRASPGAVLWEPQSYLSYDCQVAEWGGRVVGFVVCRALPGGESEVLSLVVDPQVRRRGVGSRMMRAVLGASPGTWYLEVRESNWPARKLYQTLGFEDVATRANYYQDTGETAVVMRLQSC